MKSSFIQGEEIVVAVANDLRDEGTPYAQALLGYLSDSQFARDMRDYANAQLRPKKRVIHEIPTRAQIEKRVKEQWEGKELPATALDLARMVHPPRKSKPTPGPDPTFLPRKVADAFLTSLGEGPAYKKALRGWLNTLTKTLAAMFETGEVGRDGLENIGIKIRSTPGISRFPALDLKSAFLAASEEPDGEIIGWVTNGHYAFGPVQVPDGVNAAYQKVGATFYLVPKDYDPTAPTNVAWSELVDMGKVIPIADLRDGSWTKKWTELFPVGVLIERGDRAGQDFAKIHDPLTNVWHSGGPRFFPVGGPAPETREWAKVTRGMDAITSTRILDEKGLGGDLRKVKHSHPPKLLFSKTPGAYPKDLPYGRDVSQWAREQGIWGGANLTYMMEAWAWLGDAKWARTRFFSPNDNPLSPIVVLEAKRVDRAMERREGFDKGGINSWERVAIVMPMRLD